MKTTKSPRNKSSHLILFGVMERRSAATISHLVTELVSCSNKRLSAFLRDWLRPSRLTPTMLAELLEMGVRHGILTTAQDVSPFTSPPAFLLSGVCGFLWVHELANVEATCGKWMYHCKNTLQWQSLALETQLRKSYTDLIPSMQFVARHPLQSLCSVYFDWRIFRHEQYNAHTSLAAQLLVPILSSARKLTSLTFWGASPSPTCQLPPVPSLLTLAVDALPYSVDVGELDKFCPNLTSLRLTFLNVLEEGGVDDVFRLERLTSLRHLTLETNGVNLRDLPAMPSLTSLALLLHADTNGPVLNCGGLPNLEQLEVTLYDLDALFDMTGLTSCTEVRVVAMDPLSCAGEPVSCSDHQFAPEHFALLPKNLETLIVRGFGVTSLPSSLYTFSERSRGGDVDDDDTESIIKFPSRSAP